MHTRTPTLHLPHTTPPAVLDDILDILDIPHTGHRTVGTLNHGHHGHAAVRRAPTPAQLDAVSGLHHLRQRGRVPSRLPDAVSTCHTQLCFKAASFLAESGGADMTSTSARQARKKTERQANHRRSRSRGPVYLYLLGSLQQGAGERTMLQPWANAHRHRVAG